MTRPNLEALIAAEARSVAPAPGREGVWSRVSASLEAGAPAPLTVEPGDPPTLAAAPVETPETAPAGRSLKVITGIGAVGLGVLLLLAPWSGAERDTSTVDGAAPADTVASEHTLEQAASAIPDEAVSSSASASARTGAEPEFEAPPPSLTGEHPPLDAGEADDPRPLPRPRARPPKPTVDEPVAPSSAAPASEMSLIATAVRQLRREDHGGALRTVESLDEHYPEGALMEERDGVRALALCGSHEVDGEPSARQFLAYAQRVRQSCLP